MYKYDIWRQRAQTKDYNLLQSEWEVNKINYLVLIEIAIHMRNSNHVYIMLIMGCWNTGTKYKIAGHFWKITRRPKLHKVLGSLIEASLGYVAR
jgi:hypothetical protein